MFRLMIVRLMQKIGKELMRKCKKYVQVDDRLMQMIGKELMRKCKQYVLVDDSQTNAEDWKGTNEKM